jgi:hypothetical protein
MMAEGKIIDVAVKKTSTGYNNNINHKEETVDLMCIIIVL